MTGITAITRDWGPNNSIVRITTTDTFYTITEPGYLTAQAANIASINNGAFEWSSDDACLIQYANGYGFFTPDYTVNFDFIPMSGSPFVQGYIKTPVTLAAFLAQYATPVLIVPAVANQILIVKGWALEWIYGSAQLAGGGAMSLEYGNTAHAGGTLATNTIAAADFTGLTAEGIEYSNGGLMPISALATVVDAGLYLSNPTANFTAGTGGSAVVHAWYSTISL